MFKAAVGAADRCHGRQDPLLSNLIYGMGQARLRAAVLLMPMPGGRCAELDDTS